MAGGDFGPRIAAMSSIRSDEIPIPPGFPSGERRGDSEIPPALAVTEDLLRALPKTDLHCHLDGSLRLKTILELAEQQKVKLPATDEDGLAQLIRGRMCQNLEEYLQAFDITLSVMQTEDSLF